MLKSIYCSVFLTVLLLPVLSFAHCEVPCGVYTDDMRITMIEEDCKTIEKAMNQVTALSADAAANQNQIVRWINNKEIHANKIQHIVTQYFMTQRIKVPAEGDAAALKDYNTKLGLLHQMLVSAMKCKQTTDPAHVAKLRELSTAFAKAYFGEAKGEALTQHHGHKH